MKTDLIEISERARQSIYLIDLSYNDSLSENEKAHMVAIFKRIERGQTTHLEEEQRLLEELNRLKASEAQKPNFFYG